MIRFPLPLVLTLVLALGAGNARAVSSPAEMLSDPQAEARAQDLGRQLRCLVCQNESLEESEADLARDLRRIVRQRVSAGDSNQQVMDWMVARYGNFVRLRPPFDWTTIVLWGSPVIALLAGLGIAATLRSRRSAPAPLSPEEKRKLADLIGH